eukprot:6033165-Amphidinium_carterae.4
MARLRQHIVANRAALKASGGLRFGARYWEDHVAKFGGNQPLSDSLIKLVEVALDPNTQKCTEKPLFQHLRKCKPLNDRELVGVCQAVSKRSKDVA